MFVFRNVLIASMLAGSALVSHAAMAVPSSPFDNLVVFGDSLSDSGNNSLVFGNAPGQVISGNNYIPGQPYASGVYSNGPVWATPFASGLGLVLTPSLAGGSNYAYGGSVTNPDQTYSFPAGDVTLPSLVSQSVQYLASSPANVANTFFVVAGGGNNARAILNASAGILAGGGDPTSFIGAQSSQYAADIGGIVDALQGAGAQHIIVWNTPNIGLVPAVLENGPNASFLGSSIASGMNDLLALRLAGEPGVQTFDLFGLIGRAASSGQFSNITDACGNPLIACNADLGSALFYDGIHPTTAAHAFVAGEMQVLAAVPEPTEMAMMLVGLLLIGAQVRRGRRRAH